MDRTPPPAVPPAENAYLPIGDPTHLSDYLGVISRRLWLVLVIFAVTTASAIWAVSRQQILYQSYATVQVNDPIQPARGMVASPSITGLDIFRDPIVSEIEVLKSSRIAQAVIDSLGLRLVPDDPGLVRSDLFDRIWVNSEMPDPLAMQLIYDQSGTNVQLRDLDGVTLGQAGVGTELLVEGLLSFTVQMPPKEERIYGVRIWPARNLYGEISGWLAAAPRDQTNIIDLTYTSSDPVLSDDILNASAQELRAQGARRVSGQARRDIDFIQLQLDSANQARGDAAAAIQEFKETQAFSSLSSREQQLIDRRQRVQDDIAALERERQSLQEIARSLRDLDHTEIEFSAIQASLPPGTSPEVRALIDDIRAQQTVIQRYLNEDRLGRGHPRVEAAVQAADALARDLGASIDARLGTLQAEMEVQLERETAIRTEQSQFPNLENELRTLEQQQGQDDEVYSYLQGQLYQAILREQATGPYVELIDEAFGANPVGQGGQINIVLGGLLGLILGVGAAFFLEYLDRTVRTSSDVEGLLGVPVLGIIPRLRRLDEEGDIEQHGKGAPLVVALDPLDPAAEAYRNLRMNLMFMSTEDEPIRTMLFSSPGPDEGKSTTAVNFAVMLAQQGQRVLLIDADLRRPSLHRSLDLLREPGLTNLLVGDATSREAVRPNVLPNLDVLPSGPFPPNPSELLNSRTMERLLEDFAGKYTQIIIDSLPILAVTDASVLAGHVDGAVLVLRSGETEQRAAERAVDQLRRLNVRIFGAVLNEVAITANDESYYLQYYYHYQPAEQGGWKRLREGLSKARFW